MIPAVIKGNLSYVPAASRSALTVLSHLSTDPITTAFCPRLCTVLPNVNASVGGLDTTRYAVRHVLDTQSYLLSLIVCSIVKIHHIELEQLYPFLAGISCVCRMGASTPQHPAICHIVINNPDPNTAAAVERIPGWDYSSLLVRLGGPLPVNGFPSPNWWPKAASDKVRNKLWRRIAWGGWAFHLHYATVFSLLEEFYAGGTNRLKHRNVPISDFGLAHGQILVTDADRIAYVLPDGKIKPGPDPSDHWWIWFRTARGDELTLDFGTYTWNLCVVVQVSDHIGKASIDMAPATFRMRSLARSPSSELLYTEDKRISILRDPILGRLAVERSQTIPIEGIIDWAVKYALERQVSASERKLMSEWIGRHVERLQTAIDRRAWRGWPETARVAIDHDHSEIE